ncbi:Hcp family type VI secretion system effector [Microbulbifer sp. S227A]|uniref:Hcp family type VI secretion system effector n=1 Tax=Microbulbifer sp. S227A TaxID=3415131 RepID=UPI003C7B397D
MENAFVEITGADGESMDKGHPNWIPLKSVSFNVERTLDMSDLGTTQRGYANANFGKISLTSELSLASPKLMLSVANGTVRDKTVIHLCRSGKDGKTGMEPYLIFTLTHSVIDKYEVSGGEEQIPEENWDLAYRTITVDYKAADPETGALTKDTSNFAWNVMKNEMI